MVSPFNEKLGFGGQWLKYKIHAKSLGKALSISVANQAVSSGTNFGMGVYLVRVLSPEDYGLYGIGFAISLFYAGIGNALFLLQMVVLAPNKTPEDRVPYAARIFLAVMCFTCLSFLLVILIFIVGGFGSSLFVQYRQYGIAVAAASSTYFVKEFFVRHAYNVRRERLALAIHLVLAASLTVLLSGLHFVHQTVSVEGAIWAYAFAHAIASLSGYFLAGLSLQGITCDSMIKDIKDAWHGGKWALLTNFVYFMRIHAHTIIVAVVVGPLGVAKLNASRLFVTPAVMLTPALSQVFLPWMANTNGGSSKQAHHIGQLFTLALLGVAIIYSLSILLAFDIISPLVVGERYDSIFWLVATWCVYTCVLSLRNGQEIMVQVYKVFKKQTFATTLSALVTIFSVWLLSGAIGMVGAVLGMCLGECLLVWLYCRKGFWNLLKI